MKVPLSWIKESLGRTILSDNNIIEALERAGIEIEQITSSKEIDKKIVVGLVKKVVQHPGADRLKLVDIEVLDDNFRVVCGAPNVRDGIKVALAQIGAILPSGDRIQKAKLRGEVSEGMLCSEFELGIGDNHDGILELPQNTADGLLLCDIYPKDTILDVKTPANRFDLLSIIGLAREVAAMTNEELMSLSSPAVAISKSGPEIEDLIEAKRYMLAHITISQSLASPDYIQKRLRSAGMRPISPVVDVTNYVMLQLGQPLHAFDAAKVKLPIGVRRARSGESLTTLDGVKRKLITEDLVIVDQRGPIALAGLMGGAATEVDADTTSILLEAAVFEGSVVRKMAKRHGLRTEASGRIERDLSVQLPPLALARAMELLEEVAQGKLQATTDRLAVWPWVQRIGLRVSRLSRLMGLGITHKQAIAALGKQQIQAHSFDITSEAHSHLGKPYKFGASYKADSIAAFDCSYLTDYIYSLIGLSIGHTAKEQYDAGRPVDLSELSPGDLVFRGGSWSKLDKTERGGVAHVALYVGSGKVVEAANMQRINDTWQLRPVEQQGVILSSLTEITEDSEFLGARRYADDLEDFISVPEVPWWRQDLELPEDLVEEIVRVIGYDKIPATVPSWRPVRTEFDRVRSKRRRVRDVMYAGGLFEVMTYSFVSAEQLKEWGYDLAAHMKLKNPLSSEQAYLRSSLLPSHLAILVRNRTYAKDISFYEISATFIKKNKGEQPDEPVRLGVTVSRTELAYAHAKGILDSLAQELNIAITVEPQDNPIYGVGRAGVVRLNGQEIGIIGLIHPERIRVLKLQGEVAYLEIDLNSLLEAGKDKQFIGINRFPTITRDLTVLLSEDVTWQAIAEALAPRPLTFVSDYYGDGLPPGQKSLTMRLMVINPDRTPTETEAVDLERQVMSVLKLKFGAQIRG